MDRETPTAGLPTMKTKPKTKREDSFLGTWKCNTDDSTARFVVRRTRTGQLKVSGYDSADGETFIICGVRLNRGALSFESVMRSTGQRAEHFLTPDGEGRVTHRLTVFETWVCETSQPSKR